MKTSKGRILAYRYVNMNRYMDVKLCKHVQVHGCRSVETFIGI
jgi:hypothetical protein